jgi:hypothetical protein
MAERRTLRYWPWLILCILATLLFGGLAFVTGSAAVTANSVGVRVFNGIIAIGLGVLALYSIANLYVRTRLDAEGATAIWPFSRRRLQWRDVERLDVAHVLAGWVVRCWAGNQPVVIFICHDTHGKRPKPETYDTPPVETPKTLHQGYAEIERFWRSAEGRQPVQ